jgi:hypothetical protein
VETQFKSGRTMQTSMEPGRKCTGDAGHGMTGRSRGWYPPPGGNVQAPNRTRKLAPGASRGCQVRVTTENHHRTEPQMQDYGETRKGNSRTQRRRHSEDDAGKAATGRSGIRGDSENRLEGWSWKSGDGRVGQGMIFGPSNLDLLSRTQRVRKHRSGAISKESAAGSRRAIGRSAR